MAATLTVFEHEAVRFDWTNRDMAALERLRKRLGADVLRPTLAAGQLALQAAHYVGVVRLGHRTVQVLPKIYQSKESASEEERAQQATRNLLHLLAAAGQVLIREHEIAPLLQRDLDWFEILTHLFASNLSNEWKRGASRSYQGLEDDLPVLKGKWRVAEQFRRPERKHIFAVAYDEFTADNPLNRVFRFVVERLWRLTSDSGNRRHLGELRQWMDEVTLVPAMTAADAPPSLVTRLNPQYAPLLNLARLFLDGSSLQLAADDLTAFAFVFDMNALFEAFLVNLICRRRDQILPAGPSAYELLPHARGAARHLAHSEGKPAFRLEPDLAVCADGQFSLLVDAKYKRLTQEDGGRSVSQADFYQMHAYARRYSCRRIVMLYPQTADMPQPLRREFTLNDCDATIKVATVDVRVDLGRPEGQAHIVNELAAILTETKL